MTSLPDDQRRSRAADDERSDEDAARLELLSHAQALLEPLMVALGLLFLALLLLDYSGLMADRREGLWLSRSLTIIWGVFVVDFAVRFLIAPRKRDFLASNWFSALSLALPFLRPFRALRAVRAARSLSLVRLLGGVNRGMRVLRRVAGGHQIAYLAGLTLVVVLAGATGVWFFERGEPDASIRSFGDALWWASAMVTTINNEKFAVSPEARVLAILLRVYAVSVFGFITATIATYLIGRDAALPDADETPARVAALQREVALLREALQVEPPAGRVEPPADSDTLHSREGGAESAHELQ